MGHLATKIYALSREGSLRISHQKLYASHDSPTKILAMYKMRLLSYYEQPKKRVYVARALLTAYASSIVFPVLLGCFYLALFFLALPPMAIILWYIARCLGALKIYRDAGTRHVFGAALIGLIHTLNHAVSRAFPKAPHKA